MLCKNLSVSFTLAQCTRQKVRRNNIKSRYFVDLADGDVDIAFGRRVVSLDEAIGIVNVWLMSSFDGGRRGSASKCSCSTC